MKVLLVGLGSIGRKHVAALRELESKIGPVEITALRTRGTQSGADQAGIKHITAWPSEPRQFDFVIISNPTDQHVATVRAATESSLPMFIEKPLANSLDELAELGRKIDEKGLLTYIACNLRFHPCLEFIKSHLEATKPRINEVSVYCGSYLPEWRPDQDFRKSYSVDPKQGGGVHFDLIHELDYCRFLFGDPLGSRGWFSHNSSLEIAAADHALYLLRYESFSASIRLNYYRRDRKREIEIVTSEATLVVDFASSKVTKNGELLFEANVPVLQTYVRQMSYFIDCLKYKKRTFNDFSEGSRTVALALKAEPTDKLN